MEKRRIVLVIVFITSAGLIARLYATLNAVTIAPDGFDYINMARGFVEGNWWSEVSVIRRPLYPFLLALASRLTENYEFAGRLVSLFFGTLVIPLSFYIGKYVYNDRAGLITAFFVSIHPYMIRYSGEVLTETLFHFLFAVVVLLALRVISNRNVSTMFAVGFFTILAYLTRPGAIIIWSVITLLAIYHADGFRRLTLLLVGLAFLFLMAFPYLYLAPGKDGGLVFTGNLELSFLNPVQTITTGITLAEKLVIFSKDFPQGVTFWFLALFLWGLVRRCKDGLSPSEQCLIAVTGVLWVVYLFISPSERYFVHAMPAALVFATVGFERLNLRLGGRVLTMAVLVLLIGLLQFPRGFVKLQAPRLPERLAGKWLLEQEGQGVYIISQLPIVVFYARGNHIRLPSERLKEVIEYGRKRGAQYVAGYSEELGRIIPDFDSEWLKYMKPLKSFGSVKGGFVIYRLNKHSTSFP